MTTSTSKESSLRFLKQTIDLAKNSPPKPTNFRVGCVIVAYGGPNSPQILSTGYTLELEGNTHAEQCALRKLASDHSIPEDDVGSLLSGELNIVLYTSLEPCGKRLSGNLACVQRIINTRKQHPEGGIRKVVFGAKEPGTFVQDSQSCKLLTEATIEWEYLPDLEQDILTVAMEGHVKDEKAKDTSEKTKQAAKPAEAGQPSMGAGSAPQEHASAEAQPRNPKKRMMEAPPGSEESRS
ncbi:hypothetical protein LTR70_006711 [Exophiala xenobiotica]|uniref:CMP/dCMP-type deaminase domain-containing protein n=1 Tax=Lithohypha guttulata TaxID=1690604 RepID=A0ABR0K6L2_9EURO|nr:hypothetical protein LTR24_006210 [Lithohypha guttulata]KAK5315627.1 hypothetical protein LTR70_006711 [Exophiala xenobiotica]